MSTLTLPRTYVSPSVKVSIGVVTTLKIPELPWGGNVWDLRRVTIADADDPFHVHCNAVAIIATPFDTNVPPSTSDAADFAVALPYAFTWGARTIVLTPSQGVVIWVSGADAGRALVATIQIEEALDARFT